MKRRAFISLLGGAAAWPLGARAQPLLPVVGFLSTRSPGEAEYVTAAYRQGLNETGYVEGRNVAIDYRWAELQYDRLPTMAGELVNRQVAVIAAVGGIHSGLAAKAATATIPIVFVSAGDPIEFGLVPNLNRPGGNITGVNMITVALAQKRLELLTEVVPVTAVIALLTNPTSPYFEPETKDVLAAARRLGRQIHVLNASTERDIDAAFVDISQRRTGALVISGDPFFDSRREQLVKLAASNSVPVIYQWREFVTLGGLMSYGTSIIDAYRQAGVYTGRILRGTKPADLPVIQPTQFEFVVNLKTARSLGLEITPKLLAFADEVIE